MQELAQHAELPPASIEMFGRCSDVNVCHHPRDSSITAVLSHGCLWASGQRYQLIHSIYYPRAKTCEFLSITGHYFGFTSLFEMMVAKCSYRQGYHRRTPCPCGLLNLTMLGATPPVCRRLTTTRCHRREFTRRRNKSKREFDTVY